MKTRIGPNMNSQIKRDCNITNQFYFNVLKANVFTILSHQLYQAHHGVPHILPVPFRTAIPLNQYLKFLPFSMHFAFKQTGLARKILYVIFYSFHYSFKFS